MKWWSSMYFMTNRLWHMLPKIYTTTKHLPNVHNMTNSHLMAQLHFEITYA